MNIWLETIKTSAAGAQTAELAKYGDEMTAAVFFHKALDTNIRLVQDGTLKAFYANLHNESGVILRQERWEQPEPDPDPVVDPTP